MSSTALCSVTWVMMWFPRSRYISAMPLIARLFDSVAPEVKMISLAVAPISLAICSRAFSTAASASHPNEWLRLAAFPNIVVKIRHHRLQHARIERRGRVIVHIYRQMHACRHADSSIGGCAHCFSTLLLRICCDTRCYLNICALDVYQIAFAAMPCVIVLDQIGDPDLLEHV